MSRINGWIDPETRGYLETANAAVRPGRHQPNNTEEPASESDCEPNLRGRLPRPTSPSPVSTTRSHPTRAPPPNGYTTP